MENGMKTVPTTLPTKERWIKIAEFVDDKSAKDCFERYKEILAKMKTTSK
jgi:hypothetical protein